MKFELSSHDAHVYASPNADRSVMVLYRDLMLMLDPDEAEMLALALTQAVAKARNKPTFLYGGT